MTLSSAIRLGAMLKPKGEGWLLRHGTTCALGAACDAVGMLCADLELQPSLSKMEMAWPILATRVAHPMIAPRLDVFVSDAIFDLNDIRGWTREQIADWVETIEAQRAPDAKLIETPGPEVVTA